MEPFSPRKVRPQGLAGQENVFDHGKGLKLEAFNRVLGQTFLYSILTPGMRESASCGHLSASRLHITLQQWGGHRASQVSCKASTTQAGATESGHQRLRRAHGKTLTKPGQAAPVSATLAYGSGTWPLAEIRSYCGCMCHLASTGHQHCVHWCGRGQLHRICTSLSHA